MSQQGNLDTISTVGSLVYENYTGRVQPHLEFMGPTLAIFQQMGPGEFNLLGEKLVFAADVLYAGGAMGTTGWLPDHEYQDPINFETTPTRSYVRRAVDNFIVARAAGPDGTFEPFIGRVMEQMWDALERMQNRHVHGSSTGYVSMTKTRTSNTVIVMDDGYGHSGADPGMFIEPGMTMAWLDADNSYAVGGSGVVSTVSYGTNECTVTFAASIENGSGTPTIAANDPWVFSTSTPYTQTHFDTEYGNAPLGLLDHIDPLAATATYLGVTEASYPRVKPVTTASSNFDEVEIMEHWKKIFAKSGAPVTSGTHVNTLQPGMAIELAKTLLPYTQIQTKGADLPGGWETVTIQGQTFVEDPYHLQDIMYTLCRDDCRVIDLDGDPRIWAGDGSEFARIADFDGKEWYARHYVQRIMTRRNRSGALTGLTNSNAANYTPSPNW